MKKAAKVLATPMSGGGVSMANEDEPCPPPAYRLDAGYVHPRLDETVNPDLSQAIVEAKQGQAPIQADGQRAFAFYPPTLLGGVKCQALKNRRSDHFTIGLHWIRLVGPSHLRTRLRETLQRQWGTPQTRDSGRLFYRQGERYESGVELLWQPVGKDQDHCCVDVPGKALDELGFFGQLDLLKDLGLGMHATRIDVAADFKDTPGLIGSIFEACRNGSLVGARKWKPDFEFSGAEKVTSATMRIGSRGDGGSGRYVRCYDKGLESGDAAPGEWERFEVEFSGEVANLTFQMLVEKPTAEMAAAVAFGAVDFRESNGDKHVARRPRLDWWQRITSGLELVRAKAKQTATQLIGFAQWMVKCSLPTLEAMSRDSGLSVGQVVEILTGGQRASQCRRGLAVRQFVELIETGEVPPGMPGIGQWSDTAVPI